MAATVVDAGKQSTYISGGRVQVIIDNNVGRNDIVTVCVDGHCKLTVSNADKVEVPDMRRRKTRSKK